MDQIVNHLRIMQSASSAVKISAIPAVVLSLRERISGELDRSHLERVYFPGDPDYVMVTSNGEEAVLTATARESAKLGLILLEMRHAAEDLQRVVG